MARMTRTRVEAAPAEDYDESGLDEFTVQVDEKPVTVKTRMRRPTGPITSGWGAPPVQRRETVKAPYFNPSTKKTIVKPLNDEPAARFSQHYLNNIKKFMTCIAEDEVTCPLCAAGHSPSVKYMINVVEMNDPETVKTWTFGPEVSQLLQEHLEDKGETYPLSDPKTYFKVWRVTGANNRIQNRLEFVKARDLEDDNLEPLNDEELDALSEKLYGEETVWISSDKQLREAAASYAAFMASKND